MDVGVELVARLAGDLLEASAGEQAGELLLHELHALGDLRLLVVLGGVERPLEVVEHGQELADERLRGPRRLHLGLAGDPLSVVVEVGREPAQVVQVLLGATVGVGEIGLDVGVGLRLGATNGVRPLRCTWRCNVGIRPRFVVPLRHERSPVSSTTSASTISSSPASALSAPSPLPAPVVADCWACW